MQKTLNLFYRIFIFSIICFFKVIFSRKFADHIYYSPVKTLPEEKDVFQEIEKPEEKEIPQKIEVVENKEPKVDGVYLLSLLQKNGQLVDFLKQDIVGFSNEEVGEAARVIHDGCSSVLKNYFSIESIRSEEEGEQVKIDVGFDTKEIQLTGNIQGKPPFQGELLHHGWKVVEVTLPQRTDDEELKIIAPAEVEV